MVALTHDYHEGQPGYHPDQILKDGCQECKQRADNPALAISHLDVKSFVLAWQRAIDFEYGRLDNVSVTEVPFLRLLWGINAKFRDMRSETTFKVLTLGASNAT